MKHPTYYPGYKSKYPPHQPIAYVNAGRRLEYLVIVRSDDKEAANIDEEGRFWEVWSLNGSHTETKFPSLDEALRYAETKMALGILGEKE